MSQENQKPDETINPQTSASGPNVGDVAKKGVDTATNAVKQKAGEKVRNWVAKKLGKETLKTTAKLSLSGPLAMLLFKVFVVLVIIILVIGIIMFIVTMPGLIMDKLKNLAQGIADAWLAWWGGDSSKQVSEEDIYETLDYIEEMGFDLKGYGFLTDYVTSSEDIDDFIDTYGLSKSDYNDRANKEEDGDPRFDEDVGVVRNASTDNIILASSDFVNAYLASENYLYTIKNFNQADIGAWSGFWDRLGALFSDSMKNRTGMLVFKHEGGDEIGNVSDDMYDSFERGHIKADPESKSLEIKKGWTNGKMKFSLDGWTGRYGMPLDFLVTIQTATFMPDLAYDMTQNFNTEVNILLHESKGDLVGCYKTDAGTYIKYEDISYAINGVSGRGLSNIISEIDEWGLSKAEATKLLEFGIIPSGHNPPTCGCEVTTSPTIGNGIVLDTEVDNKGTETTDDDETKYYYEYYDTENATWGKIYVEDETTIIQKEALSKIGGGCKEYLKAVVKYTDANNKWSYETYTPYIEKVTDHWYRDVYFISNSSVKSFVDYDYDYEAIMKERWTLYEKYTADEADKGTYKYNPDRVGQEILLVINEKGEYKKENGDYVAFDGTIEDANPSVVYEKDAEGNYVKSDKSYDQAQEAGITLYRESSSGDYVVYTGDVAVSKKAVTINIADKFDDLNWNDLGGGVYSAYSPDETQLSDWQQPLKTGVADYDDANGNVKSAMNRIYVEVKIGTVNQTGEGQRTETNSKIKKMFLQNNYFRYDGSAETAEIITELRKKIYEDRKQDDSSAEKYGPLTNDELDKEYTISYGADENRKENVVARVGDYAGKLEVLTQDALNAFSMLENTHTLDADYIYRDFKELIVELGYFEKEQLTDETPRLLQFPVPSIGSAEYPARSIDKRVQEKGTMLHSKYDIETNLTYISESIEKSEVGDLESETEKIENTAGIAGTEVSAALASRINEGRVGLSVNSSINITEVGSIAGSKKASQVTVKEFLEKTREMCKYINEVGYDYCVMCVPGESKNGDTCTCTDVCKQQFDASGKCLRVIQKKDPECTCKANHCKHSIHYNNCYLAPDFESSKASGKNNFCCDRLVKWALQNVGLIPKDGGAGGAANLASYIQKNLGGKVIEHGQALKEGDILCSSGHIEIVGERSGNAFVQYNGGHEVVTGASEGDSYSSIGLKTESDSWSWAEYAIRLPWSQSEDALYEGYEGNEAVVSPVTGVLVDYGTYNREDDQKRENIDLKYGPSVKITLDEETGEIENVEVTDATETTSDENAETQATEENYEPVYDEVGYAVIRVMTKEDFEHLESNIQSYWSKLDDEEGLLDPSGSFRDKLTKESELEDLLDPEKTTNGFLAETIYGYKEFAELYSTYGIYVSSKTIDEDEKEDDDKTEVETVRKLIAGYTIFIDGFKCELPDENFVDTNEDGSVADELTKPNGKDLTIDSFKIAPSKIEEENELIQSQYEMADEYKLASKSATERINLEELIKADAYPVMEVDDVIYIKEGTVIGRTYTDREVVEDLRENEKVEDYKISMTKTKEELKAEDYVFQDKLIGNYLRIIMQEAANTTPVEDVENYMKLDEAKRTGNQEYQFQEGDLEILADAIHHEGCGAYCAVLLGTSGEEDELYLSKSVGFTIINKLNTDSGFAPDYNDSSKLWDSSRSPLYNLLCRIPSGYDTGGYTTGTSGGWYAIALGLRQRIDADDLEYCDTCYEAAEYIKENDSMNHTNNGKFGADFSMGEGMPHTCWQQGAGYNGSSKIWVYIDKNKNGVKDTECVDSGDFYLFDTAN